MIPVIDKHGTPGHPTKRFDLIRKLRRKGKARIIGGGVSGKPPVVMLLHKTFDPTQTILRRYVITIDPGYIHIGFTVCEIIEGKLRVIARGILQTRISQIKLLMTDRRMYRRFRRYVSRKKKKRLSLKYGQVLTKFKQPRSHRSKNKMNVTLKHGIETHLNLINKLKKLFALPPSQAQIIMEDNVFDIRTMTWGPTSGKGYQQSPRQPKQQKYFICGSIHTLNEHHLIQRKKGGTDVPENKLYLCEDCHSDVHAGRIYIPVTGISQWRALGTMNAIIGCLRKEPNIIFIPAPISIKKRRELGLPKDHSYDALATAITFAGTSEIDKSTETYLELTQYRRHSRARIHAYRDRLYKLNNKIIARNRCKRTDQKEPSFSDISVSPSDQKNLKIYPGVRLIKSFRSDMPTISGDVWQHISGPRFVATGVTSGKYLYSAQLKDIVGKPYIQPAHCRLIIRNEGIVIQ